MIAAHITHEAVEKVGGIGAVIAGLVTSKAYQRTFSRTVVAGPLLATDRPAAQRLGPGGKVLYSSLDDVDAGGWAGRFKPVEQTYQVGIIYGIRKITNGNHPDSAEVEVLLVDVFRYNRDRLNLFKAELFSKFAAPSERFEHIWEYEEYVRLAEPAYEALGVIGCRGSAEEPLILLAHEYMGIPTALKAILDGPPHVRTIFYAHEVAPVRHVVEKHEGHDLMFHNLLAAGEQAGKSLEEFFPQVRDNFKYALVKAARHCDAIFAVGDMVAREMRFLDPSCRDLPVEVVYNGVPASRQTLEERCRYRAGMIEYAKNLFGSKPDYIFTHVARPVLSKGIWRDLGVLHELDGLLSQAGKSAAYFMLGTLAGQRRTKDVLHMERSYGWPVHHQLGYPDLCNGEETPAEMFEDFNRNHEAVRVVLVNQFGWESQLCGLRMPRQMSLANIRQGTDVEFGLSVYEPFGISQLEPLSYGAICVVSNVCGCLGIVRRCAAGRIPANVLEADFTRLPTSCQAGLPRRAGVDPRQATQIGRADRDVVEAVEDKRLAEELFRRLPKTQAEMAELLDSGWELGKRMDWEPVVRDLFGPAVQRTWELDRINGSAT